MFSIEGKKLSPYQNNKIDLNDAPSQHIIEDDNETHTKTLEWLKALYIEDGDYHPCFGVSLTLYLNLLHEHLIDLTAYPRSPLGRLTKLKNNGLGIEELAQRLNLPFQIIENAKDIFRGRIAIDPKMRTFTLSIQEYVETYQKLGLPWDYSSVTIFGGDTPLTKDYLKNLFSKKLKLRKTSEILIQLAIDRLPPARMHDTDTHFYIRDEKAAARMNLIKDRISTVIEYISEKNLKKIAKSEIFSKCFSNYFQFPASKTSLITIGTKERTWDIISVWETDFQKIPRQFTNADLEFPIYDSEGHKIQAIRPECAHTDPWACLFHTILNICWLANYTPGEEHPAINMGLFLKICIETTKGKMFLQNISGIAIDTFFQAVPNAKRFHEEIDKKLKHLRKSNETSIALSLNIVEFLGDFTKENPEYLQTCIDLLPKMENKKEFHSKVAELIHKYPDNTRDILDTIKGSIIVSYVFQRIAQPDAEMESEVRLTIIDGAPGLTYLINGTEGAHFSFKIEAKKTFESIIKIHVIYGENKEFLSDLASLHLLCTDGLKPRPLPPVNLNMTLEAEFNAIGLSEETLFPVILNLVHSGSPLCGDMAFHLLRMAKLWDSKQIKWLAKQSLTSSALLYPGRLLRKTRSSLEANILSEIPEEELIGIILPQKPRIKQNEASSKTIEKDIFQLKTEVNKDLFDQLLANINKIETEENGITWQKITCQLISKLSNVQNPIIATFSPKTRQQFEKSIYHLLKFVLKQNELRPAVHLFKWSLEQNIFLYNWTSWVFITGHLLSPCLENALGYTLEPILIQFSHHTQEGTFQRFLRSDPDKEKLLEKFFPNLFLATKPVIDLGHQSNINVIFDLPKDTQKNNNQVVIENAIQNREGKKETILEDYFTFLENKELQAQLLQEVDASHANLMKKLEALYKKIGSKSKKKSRKNSLKVLSFAFRIQSFEDPVEKQAKIPNGFYRWNDDLKIIFIKTAYEASRYIKDSSSRDLAIKQLFLFWKKNSPLNIGEFYENKFLLNTKEEVERSQSLFNRLSRMTYQLLKPNLKLLLGVGVLYGSKILMERLFFYEEEPSLTEELIKGIAVNTIQSVAEHCMTFHFPYGGEMKNCYESEFELSSAEKWIAIKYPLTLLHEGKTYIIKPALPNWKYHHGLTQITL